jgi:hypothetical protein
MFHIKDASGDIAQPERTAHSVGEQQVGQDEDGAKVE